MRRIQEIVTHLRIDQLPPASAPRMVKDLDNQIQTFLLRPVERTIPYPCVDASYCKGQGGARDITKAVISKNGA